MSRWTPSALADVQEGISWEEFTALHPEYSYDAWEVKRRRVSRSAETPEIPATVIEAAADGVYVGPSICFFDFETTFSTQPRMLSAAGADGFGNVTLFDLRFYGGLQDWLNDKEMCLAIRDYLEAFDIIASWNGKLFDVPVLNGRLALHRQRPLSAQMHVDLMYYATGQFMRIGSKSLKSVSEYFDSPHKKTPLSPRLWDAADHGDMDAYGLILEHNVADALVTRDLWSHLSPYIRTIHRAG